VCRSSGAACTLQLEARVRSSSDSESQVDTPQRVTLHACQRDCASTMHSTWPSSERPGDERIHGVWHSMCRCRCRTGMCTSICQPCVSLRLREPERHGHGRGLSGCVFKPVRCSDTAYRDRRGSSPPTRPGDHFLSRPGARGLRLESQAGPGSQWKTGPGPGEALTQVEDSGGPGLG
jgi:hypothetical protein